MEAISQPPDTRKRPPDEEFVAAMGKVALFSEEYPTEDENGDPVEPEYDDCACVELALTEQLLPGQHVELAGPFPSSPATSFSTTAKARPVGSSASGRVPITATRP